MTENVGSKMRAKNVACGDKIESHKINFVRPSFPLKNIVKRRVHLNGLVRFAIRRIALNFSVLLNTSSGRIVLTVS